MARIDFVHADEASFVRVVDMYAGDSPDDEAKRSKIPTEELEGQAVRFLFKGGPASLQLFEVRCAPNTQFNTHAHDEDEIMYITQGEILLGKRSYPAGSSIYIPGKTLYAFRSGPEGLQFLNFRAAADFTYITRDELVSAKQSATMSDSSTPHDGTQR